MWPLCWVGGCVRARRSDDLFVCFGAKPKQTAWAWDLPRDRKYTRRGGSQRRQKWVDKGRRREAVDDEEQSVDRAVSRRRQEKMEAGQRRESTEVRKATAKTWWPTERPGKPTREDVSMASSFCRSFAKNTDARRMQSITKLPFLSLKLKIKVHVVRCSSFHPLSCILCGRYEMCDSPIGNY